MLYIGDDDDDDDDETFFSTKKFPFDISGNSNPVRQSKQSCYFLFTCICHNKE